MSIVISPEMIIDTPRKNLINNNIIKNVGYGTQEPLYEYVQKVSIDITQYDYPGIVNKTDNSGRSYAVLGSSKISDFTNILSNNTEIVVLASQVERYDEPRYKYSCFYIPFENADISDNVVNKTDINFKYCNQSGIITGNGVEVVPWVYNNQSKTYEYPQKFNTINDFFSKHCVMSGNTIEYVKSDIGYEAGSMNFIFGVAGSGTKYYLCCIVEIMEVTSSDSNVYEKALLEYKIIHSTKCLKFTNNQNNNRTYDYSLSNAELLYTGVGQGSFFYRPETYLTSSYLLEGFGEYFYAKYYTNAYGIVSVYDSDRVVLDAANTIAQDARYYRTHQSGQSRQSNQVYLCTNFRKGTTSSGYTKYDYDVYVVTLEVKFNGNPNFTDIKEVLSDNIKEQYKNGKQTITFSALYGEYKDESGNIIYTGNDGNLLKIDDEILPQKLRDGKLVPFSKNLDGSAKKFIIYDAEFVFPGNYVNCKAIEKI